MSVRRTGSNSSVRSQKEYCCPAKRYFSNGQNVSDTLVTTPRTVFFRRGLKVNRTYETTLTIKNAGLYPRKLTYDSDCPEEITIKPSRECSTHYLQPEGICSVNISLTPRKKALINRTRRVFVQSTHPSVAFEVLIFASTPTSPVFPSGIKFLSTVPNTQTYYEAVIYNPMEDGRAFSFRGPNPALMMNLREGTIRKKSYIRQLFTLSVRNMKVFHFNMKIKFPPSTFVLISMDHRPLPFNVYINLCDLYFNELLFDRQEEKEFTVCNEGNVALEFESKIISEDTYEDLAVSELSSEHEVRFSLKGSLNSMDLALPPPPKRPDHYPSNGHKHYEILEKIGRLEANSCTTLTVVFCPKMAEANFEDSQEPPYQMKTKLIFTTKYEDMSNRAYLHLYGSICGPAFEFHPSSFDIRKVYLGEEHCLLVKALNIDAKVKGKVYFKDHTGKDVMNVTVTPEEGYELDSCEHGAFKVNLFAIEVGRFSLALQFKVQNGKSYNVIIRGLCQVIRPKVFPDAVDLGVVPFAIPQKRYVLLINPLSVPICVKLSRIEDGCETPLVLDIRDCTRLPPVTVRNPIRRHTDIVIDDEPSRDITPSDCLTDAYGMPLGPHDEWYMGSFHSVTSDTTRSSANSECSTVFEEQVVVPLESMAGDFLNAVRTKTEKSHDKGEVEKNIAEEAMYTLLALPYFAELTNSHNFAYMDWNLVPNDPRELYFDCEIFYMKPNGTRKVTVLTIPNRVGYQHSSIELRVCPINEEYLCGRDLHQVVVSSRDTMVSKLPVEYNCQVPDVIWSNQIELNEEVIYAGQEIDFDVEFQNNSNVGGFIFFDVVPDCPGGVMSFKDDTWKFVLSANGFAYAYCSVIFRQYGYVRLDGIVKVVGLPEGSPFQISANVLPTRIRVSPPYLHYRQQVLTKTKVHIFIYNLTPTITPFTVRLKDETFQYIEPLGGILNPKGQGTYVTIHSYFYDPQIVKNSVHINLPYGKSMFVPVTFTIEGMPIFFEPSIKEAFQSGCILTTTKENFLKDITNYSKTVKVINRGLRTYRIIVKFCKTLRSTTCSAEPSKGRLFIAPHSFRLLPGESCDLKMEACGYEELCIDNEYTIRIVDQENKQRLFNTKFVASICFCDPKMAWDRREVKMEYRRTHKFKDLSQLAVVELMNCVDSFVESVYLKAMGPFKIKTRLEDKSSKELTISFEPFEHKEIIIFLTKSTLQNEYCSRLDGRIGCIASNKLQKSLLLSVNILNPSVTLEEPYLLLFTTTEPRDVFVPITNVGCMEAPFKWKKLDQRAEYAADYDNSFNFAHEILSDIFLMLDIYDSSEDGFDEETNMTLRYQHYRCRLNKLQDESNGVKEILDEIINNLNLENRRYHLNFDGDLGDRLSLDNSLVYSSATYVRKTVHHMLGMLKLEDSYEVSPASSIECLKDRVVNFDEKEGILAIGELRQCLLHCPGVRKGYELCTSFLLDVVGSEPKFFEVVLVNFEQTIRIPRDNIYLGIKPWYELFRTRVEIHNITKYTIKLQFDEVEKLKPHRFRPSEGYAKIRDDRLVYVPPFGTYKLPLEGVVGFCDNFCRSINVMINDSGSEQIRLRAQGVMPILWVTSKLPREQQDLAAIWEEYELLQSIYYMEVFRSITEEDDVSLVAHGEEARECGPPDYVSLNLSIDSSEMSIRSRDRRFFNIIKSYVLVNNNEELPNAMVLEQLLESERFLKRVRTIPDVNWLLNMVYRDYVKMVMVHDDLMPVNLKYFTVQPLPYALNGYVLDMGAIKLRQVRKVEFLLHFFGPGKLIAAARTVIRIPGFAVDFHVDSHFEGTQFLYYKADLNSPEQFDKHYRNMWERELDAEADPKLKHAHSFDMTRKARHKRDLTAKERKAIDNYYNSLNKSVYMEHKHHFKLCKVYTKTNQTNIDMKVTIFVKPDAKHYTVGQTIEDYLYIDLHMGPTLPILVKGKIEK